METLLNATAPQGGGAAVELTYAERLELAVEAGQMASFTIWRDTGGNDIAVSHRVAKWLLAALAGKLQTYERGAVAAGQALRIEYLCGQDCYVVGTYSPYEIDRFCFGILHYCRRKYKHSMRRLRRAHKRNAASAAGQKGGAAL